MGRIPWRCRRRSRPNRIARPETRSDVCCDGRRGRSPTHPLLSRPSDERSQPDSSQRRTPATRLVPLHSTGLRPFPTGRNCQCRGSAHALSWQVFPESFGHNGGSQRQLRHAELVALVERRAFPALVPLIHVGGDLPIAAPQTARPFQHNRKHLTSLRSVALKVQYIREHRAEALAELGLAHYLFLHARRRVDSTNLCSRRGWTRPRGGGESGFVLGDLIAEI